MFRCFRRWSEQITSKKDHSNMICDALVNGRVLVAQRLRQNLIAEFLYMQFDSHVPDCAETRTAYGGGAVSCMYLSVPVVLFDRGRLITELDKDVKRH
jgi:hypothetical protein